jgi:hypothetical protein
MESSDIHRYFGSDATVNALKIAVRRHLNPSLNGLRDHVTRGGDAKDYNLAGKVIANGSRASFFIHFAQHIFSRT